MKVTKRIPRGAKVICASAIDPPTFADDTFSPCATCGAMLRHRPYVPEKTRKLCIPCGLEEMVTKVKQREKITSALTLRSLEELQLYFAATKGKPQ